MTIEDYGYGKGLTPEEAGEIRGALEKSQRPLIFYHDDPDGLASFLLLYKTFGKGYGVAVKSVPCMTARYLKKVESYGPDAVFIADLHNVDQEFLDGCDVPVIWIDHHEPVIREGVKYYNPRARMPDLNIPASVMCYMVNNKDIWLGAVGAIGDWHYPWFFDEFKKKYPDMVDAKIVTPDDALFASPLGELVNIFSFILKSRRSDMDKCVKILTRIKDPYELIKTETSRAKLVHKIFSRVYSKYRELLTNYRRCAESAKDQPIISYVYGGEKDAFTKDLANQALYEHPDKVILMGRDKNGEVKMSIRARNFVLPPVLEKSLEGLDGYGGGHEHACGACVRSDQFAQFLENLKSNIPCND